MIIALLGPPGAGKGTQAKGLCEHFGLLHVATGDLFRENLDNETELGRLAKGYMDRGQLVPDDVTGAMVRERLSRPDVRQGVILDGFPRTLPQAETLSQILSDLKRCLNLVLHINVADDIIIDRLCGRMICRSCQLTFHQKNNPFQSCPYQRCQGEYLYQRKDDEPAVVQARLDTFHEETSPLIGYYKAQHLLIEINGMQDIQAVTAEAISAVNRNTKP